MVHRSLSVFALIFTPLIIVCSQGGVLVVPAPQASIDAHAMQQVSAEQGADEQHCSIDTLWQLAREIAENPADSPVAVENFLCALATASPEDMRSVKVLRLLDRFSETPILQRALGTIVLPDVQAVIESIRLVAQNSTEQSYLELIKFYHTCMPEIFSIEELRFIGLFCLCASRNPWLNRIKQEVEWFKERGLFETVMSNPAKYGEKLCSPKYWPIYGPTWGDFFKGDHSSPFHVLVDNAKVDTCNYRQRAINYFLQQGVSPKICDQDGHSVLGFALDRRTSRGWNQDYGRKMILLFHKYSEKDAYGLPVLLRYIYGSAQMSDCAYSKRQQTIAAVALKMCPGLASLQVTDKEGNNSLHAAVIINSAYLAELIYALNRELASTPNKRGETPLALARDLRAWKALGGIARGTDYCGEFSILQEAIEGNGAEIVENIIVEAPELYGTTARFAADVPEIGENKIALDLKYALSQNKFNALLGVVRAAYFLERHREERASLSYKMAMLGEKLDEAILPIRKLLNFFK